MSLNGYEGATTADLSFEELVAETKCKLKEDFERRLRNSTDDGFVEVSFDYFLTQIACINVLMDFYELKYEVKDNLS